jgi:hypothetical protein
MRDLWLSIIKLCDEAHSLGSVSFENLLQGLLQQRVEHCVALAARLSKRSHAGEFGWHGTGHASLLVLVHAHHVASGRSVAVAVAAVRVLRLILRLGLVLRLVHIVEEGVLEYLVHVAKGVDRRLHVLKLTQSFAKLLVLLRVF